MYWKPISGSAPEEELTTTDSLPWPNSCSPDGKLCAYDVGPPTPATGIYLLPLSGGHKPAQVVSEPSAQDLAISPDGKWAAYQSAETGRNEIYIRQFPAGTTKWQVSAEGGVRPMWSPNGRELFFRNEGVRNKSKLMSVAVETLPSILIGRPKPLFAFSYAQYGHDYAVLPDGQHFICIQESDSSPRKINVVLNWASELKK
jgi:Tol biopolymer transport system component